MNTTPERIIIGPSADIEAEYGMAADAPFTLAIVADGDLISVEGYRTLKAAKAAAEGAPFEYVGA